MADWNFATVWARMAREVPDREALICGERVVTWGEFDERAAWLASWLWEQGARPGAAIAIDLTNRPEYLEAFLAALKLGCAPVNVNYRYLADETRVHPHGFAGRGRCARARPRGDRAGRGGRHPGSVAARAARDR